LKIRSIILCALGLVAWVNAQSDVKIHGKVLDAESNQVLVGANIIVESMAIGAVSNAHGRFEIENVLNGSYSLRAEYMGYQAETQSVRVAGGEPVFVFFRMQPIVLNLQNISVAADRFSTLTHENDFDIRIDRERIEQSGSDNVSRLLKGLPGVQVTETGSAGNAQKVSIRGSNSNQVLVFVDGVKLNDEMTGEVDLSQIPLHHVESIQVKKGGSSSLFGSGAIGGAVYISTMQTAEKRAGITLTCGPFDYFKVEPHVNGSFDRWVYTLSLQTMRSKGDYPYSYHTADDHVQHATRENADILSHNIFARAGYVNGDHQIGLRAQYYSSVRGLPGKVNYWTRYARSENKRAIYNLDYRFLTKTLNIDHFAVLIMILLFMIIAPLLLDNKLPGIKGMEVLEYIREKNYDMMVAMITSYASLEIAVKATDDGAYDFIPKPFTPQELKSSIDNISKQLFLKRITRKMQDEGKRIRYQFLSILSHELKSPLNAIEGYLLLMKDKKAGESIDNYMQMIERTLDRIEAMRNLTMDLLDFTKIRLDRREEKVEEIEVKNIARMSISTVKPFAIQKNVKIHLNTDKQVVMRADPNDLEIIFNNLLSNAVKYNKNNGEVWVNISEREDTVFIAVKDSGIGMKDEEVNQLFKEFVRIKNEKTRNIHGSGLGLSIVRKITDIYKGSIDVRTEPDKGSEFIVSLPTREYKNNTNQN